MRRSIAAAWAVFVCASFAVAACPSGAPLLEFHLVVDPASGLAGRAVRTANMILPGQKLVYAPVKLLPDQLKDAEVALVLVPAGSNSELRILKPKPATTFAEWSVPFRTSVVALVYGPQGLNKKQVDSLLRSDSDLVVQLADYAEQTARTESLIEALAAYDRSPTATENLNAALAGFSSTSGAVKLDMNAPADQQVAVMLRALNPAIAGYDPLAPEGKQKLRQSALLAATVAGLFFGGPVSLAAGGAAMFVNLNHMFFPDTEFRTAFTQQSPEQVTTLCSQRNPTRSRTRRAYLWAVRVPDAETPELSLPKPAHVPLGTRYGVPVIAKEPGTWRHLDRAREWALVGKDTGARVPVKVSPQPEKRWLELDLTQIQAAPGIYRLEGTWDWEVFDVRGDLYVHDLASLPQPHLAGTFRDRLVQGSGRVPIELRESDFQFVEKVQLQGTGEDCGPPSDLGFSLPEGKRAGPQNSLRTVVDTGKLPAGRYELLVTLANADVRRLPVRVLPPHPRLEALPLRVNHGEAEQRVTLRGDGLDRIEQIESDLASVVLLPANGASARPAVVRLGSTVCRGHRIDLRLRIEGVSEPVGVPAAMEVAGPRPRVTSAQALLPGESSVELAPDELPVGSFAGFSLRVHPLESTPEVRVACAEEALTARVETARLNEQKPAIKFRSTGPGSFFVSLDPGAIGQPGCTLTAAVSTDVQGQSDAFALGKVVRLPRIDRFELTDEKVGELGYAATITGEDLEIIERAGWDPSFGLPVTDLPVPLSSGTHRQQLRITMPWPAPAPRSVLFVWLRGEPKGRATRARY